MTLTRDEILALDGAALDATPPQATDEAPHGGAEA